MSGAALFPEFTAGMIFDPEHPFVKALVPAGAKAEKLWLVGDAVCVTYRTAQGLPEQRRWIIAATTRWPD